MIKRKVKVRMKGLMFSELLLKNLPIEKVKLFKIIKNYDSITQRVLQIQISNLYMPFFFY